MINRYKKLISRLTVAVFIILQIGVLSVSAAEPTNIALDGTVTSVTHPDGSSSADGGTKYPLNRLIDGSINNNSGFLMLNYAKDTSTNYVEGYRPVADGRPIHVCLDLGSVYDITKIVYKGRKTSGINVKDVTVWGSNDPMAKTADWEETSDLTSLQAWPSENTTISGGDSFVIEFADAASGEADLTLPLSNSAFRYIVISKANEANAAGNLTIGELEVWSTGLSAEWLAKYAFYEDLTEVDADGFANCVTDAITAGAVEETKVSNIVAMDELSDIGEWFVMARDAISADILEASFDVIESERAFLYTLRAASLFKSVQTGDAAAKKAACDAHKEALPALFSGTVDSEKFAAAYTAPQTADAQNIIKAIRFADAISFIIGADVSEIAQILEERYEDLGFDNIYLTNRTSYAAVAEKMAAAIEGNNGEIPAAYLTDFAGEITAIVDAIVLEIQEQMKKELNYQASEKGISLTVPVIGNFLDSTVAISVTDPSGDICYTENIDTTGLADTVPVVYEYLSNANELGKYTIAVTITDRNSNSASTSFESWCIAVETVAGYYNAIETAATGAAIKTAVENAISANVFNGDSVERILPLSKLEENGDIFVLAKECVQQNAFSDEDISATEASVITGLDKLQKVLEYTVLLSALDSEDAETIKSAYNTYGGIISPVVTADFNLDKFASAYRTVTNPTPQSIVSNIKLCDVLSQMKGGTYSDINRLLTTYPTELGVNLSYLSGKNVAVIEVAKRLDSTIPDSYYNGLGSVVNGIADTIAANSNNGSSSNGTGVIRPSVSVGGGGGGGGIASAVPKPQSTPSTQSPEANNAVSESFSDLQEVSWAKEAINSLTELGVVNGVGNGKFEPHQLVNREEIAKMLVIALGLHSDEDEIKCDFEDTVEGDWHYIYIKTACENGVTNGVDNSVFGVGKNVTRQDLAVMCYRAAAAKGAKLTGTSSVSEFSDSSEFADYAWLAINTLGQNGIINGFEDASFRPYNSTTRAEAAAIIYRLLTLMQQEGLV